MNLNAYDAAASGICWKTSLSPEYQKQFLLGKSAGLMSPRTKPALHSPSPLILLSANLRAERQANADFIRINCTATLQRRS